MTHDELLALAREVKRCQAALGVVDFADAPKGPIKVRWQRARNRIAEANYGLVVMTAQRQRYPGTPMEDRIQYGFLGLLKAIDRFDPERGKKFSTYAVYWIRHAVQREVANTDRLVRIPVHVRWRVHKTKKLLREGWTYEQIAAYFRTNVRALNACERLITGETVDVDEWMATDDADPAELLDAEANLVRMRELLWKLPAKDRRLLAQRYGLWGEPTRTLEQIAKMRGISRERVRQIQAQIVDVLRAGF